MKRILFTGGGSAGHAVPNLAIIEELRDSYEIFYVGTDKIEKSILAPLEIPYYTLECPKLIRGFSFSNFTIPLRLYKSVKSAKDILEKVKPDMVFSKGGYVSLPVVTAAKKLKIPSLTHESDLSAGLANKLLSNKCDKILTSFPSTADKFRNGKYTGSPIRASLFKADKKSARQKYGFTKDKPVLLFLGGGSGSKAINSALRDILPTLARKYYILHVCGKGNVIQNNIAGYIQREYESDMASAYAAADMVVARSGANTLFETLALKKKALFIPLENKKTRGDQLLNAEYFERRKLCRVLREKQLDKLFSAIEECYADKKLSENLKIYVAVNGNRNVIKEITEILN